MSLIILDRCNHYIGVEFNKGKVLIKHRTYERMDEPDSDDLFLSVSEAQKLLKNINTKNPFILGVGVRCDWHEGEFQIHYQTSWIGIGEREAEELRYQLAHVLIEKEAEQRGYEKGWRNAIAAIYARQETAKMIFKEIT